MNYQIPPKIAVINSFAGYGRCSTTEALPIISAMKVQACPVPTSIFSNHTGFPTHYSVDFTAQMPDYFAQWDALGLVFDGVYCGFLGKKEQIPLVASFLRSQRQKGCSMILVDPVMGDHGKAYKTITPEHCDALRKLVGLADIITPNITEACLLTGMRYQDSCWRKEDLEKICAALHAMGPDRIAITGLRQKSMQGSYDSFLNFISERKRPPACASKKPCDSENTDIAKKPGSISGQELYETSCTVTPAAGPSRHGTGDIFASIVAADAVKGVPFSTSIEKAAGFISTCIRASDELGIPECEGVCFENFLDTLS